MNWKSLLIGELSWWRLGRSTLLIYGIFAAYVFFRADSLIFLPPEPTYGDRPDLLKIPLNTPDSPGGQITALHLKNPTADFTLLYIHGNAEDLGLITPQLLQFHDWGYGVFAYDYEGYGTSSGTPSESHAYRNALAAYQYLTETLGVPRDRLIVYGRSVGGGSAVDLAHRVPVGGLVLESTFTSAFRVVIPFPLLPFDKFPNRRKLAQVSVPTLVLHDTADEVIPFDHGLRLYAAAPEPKFSLWVEGAGHNNFSEVAGDRHRQALAQLAAALAPRLSPTPAPPSPLPSQGDAPAQL